MEKKVLLFSGGFDSILQEWLIKPDILLYVDMETSYSQRELEFLKLLPNYYTERLKVKKVSLGEYERENKYLPYRNLILGAVAMEYGQHVYFGFNQADNAPDKDEVFIRRITSLFRHLNINCKADMGWQNKKFSFSAPYAKYTKTEMVRLALQAGMPKELIQSNRSCYDSVSRKGCGVCDPCVRRAIALVNNGLYVEGLFDKEITSAQVGNLIKDARRRNLPEDYLKDLYEARKFLRQEKE